jgi:hypothetical protein
MVLLAMRSIVQRRRAVVFVPFASGLAPLGLLGHSRLLTMRVENSLAVVN